MTNDQIITALNEIAKTASDDDAAVLRTASIRLEAMQQSLRKEVAALEVLRPFARSVRGAVADMGEVLP